MYIHKTRQTNNNSGSDNKLNQKPSNSLHLAAGTFPFGAVTVTASRGPVGSWLGRANAMSLPHLEGALRHEPSCLSPGG